MPLGNEVRHAADISGDVGIPTFMVGNSPAMREVFDQIRRFATCDAPVLITGESGTGKELVARAVHDHSARAAGPFVAINCAAIPASLIGSELFGYERGAFTGATARKCGQIEHAHRGTLLLDEIGDMPIELQGHLLRFLQEGEIVRVGGHDPIKVNVRIIAATNVRLRDAMLEGKLREDLYYRLNVLGMHVPALRERDGDIEVLATYFLRQIARDLHLDVRRLSPAAVAAMRSYAWPGNVRELIATIRRAAVMANSEEITRDDLHLDPDLEPGDPGTTVPGGRSGRPDPGSDAERHYLLDVLDRSRFNITRAAREIGVSRMTMYRMLERHNMDAPRAGSHDEGSEQARQRLVELLERTGFNISQAARELRVSRMTLYRLLERNHLALRPTFVAEDPSLASMDDAQRRLEH
jgi:DNA-binding NtrC family response regulator